MVLVPFLVEHKNNYFLDAPDDADDKATAEKVRVYIQS